MECVDAKGKIENISFRTNRSLQAIVIDEPLQKVNLDAIFYPWAPIEKAIEEEDIHDDYCYINFFGSRQTFYNKLEIYEASRKIAAFEADVIKLYRYGECGCIIHLIRDEKNLVHLLQAINSHAIL